jgi:hypothetical protein
MSVKAIKWAFAQQVGSPTGKAVLVALADNANDEGHCWPSVGTLVEKTELSPRAVIGWTEKLQKGGFISKEPCKSQNGGDTSNRYKLMMGDAQRQQGGERDALPPVHDMQPPPARDAAPPCTPCSTPLHDVQPLPTIGASGSRASRGLQTDPSVSNHHLTVIEPSPQPQNARAETRAGPVVGGGGVLETGEEGKGGPAAPLFPAALSAREREEALKLLEGIETSRAQEVLDVLAATIQAGQVRKSAVAVLRGMVARLGQGTFDPGPGLHIAEARERQRLSEARARASVERGRAAALGETQETIEEIHPEPPSREAAFNALQDMKESLRRPPRSAATLFHTEAGREFVIDVELAAAPAVVRASA